MRKTLITTVAVLFATSAFAASHTSTGILPNINVDAIVDSVLGKNPPQGDCYNGYHVKTTKMYNVKGKYAGKSVTCEEDD